MNGRPRLCVIGYASVDHKFRTAPFAGEGHTTLVHESLHSGAPQPGAVSYFAREAARRGVATEVVSWIGSDPLGDLFRGSLLDGGIGIDGVDRHGSRSPAAYMFYPVSGEPVTFFDAGDVHSTITDVQREIVRRSDIVVVMIAPHQAVQETLEAIRRDAVLGWVVKADPGSMSAPLARRIADRAAVISYSSAESDFLRVHCDVEPNDLVGPGRLLVETNGADGVVYSHEAGWNRIDPGRQVRTHDATGAGDTFAASLITRYGSAPRLGGPLDQLVADACRDAAEFLASREEGDR